MFDWLWKKSKPPVGPDFSDVDSQAKAHALFQAGKLEKLFLMPACLGGDDNPLNTLYVPIGIGAAKARIDDDVVFPLAESGEVTQYKAEPQYQGNSFIPIAVRIRAYNPGEFTTTIHIWGDALANPSKFQET